MKAMPMEPDAHMQKWNLKILKVMLKEVSVNTIVYYKSKCKKCGESTNQYKITLQYTSIAILSGWKNSLIRK